MTVTLPPKPSYGSPCNGCGLCCTLSLCRAGEVAFPGQSAPCPALCYAVDGTRTYCGLVAEERRAGLNPFIAKVLGIGWGCSMKDDFLDQLEDAGARACAERMAQGIELALG